MKIDPRRADGFIAKPDAAVRAILLYGPDAGLVRERMNLLTRNIAGSVDDPFRVTEFAADALREDPARLRDEAASLALTGGRRVVRIRDAGDSAGALFDEWLENSVGDALVIVTAGELAARSKLRAAFEESDHAAAVACYADEDAALDRLVRDTLKSAGFTVTPEALDWLIDHLGGDRELSRRELEKLVTYLGPAGNGRAVSVEDVAASVGDTAAFDLDELIYAAADGDQAVLQRIFAQLTAEGTSPISILTAASRHLVRLHDVRGRAAEGRGIDQAMMALRPPVFFKFKDRFRAQANRFTDTFLARGLELVTEAEMTAKSTDMPAAAVVERALIQIAQAAKAAQRGR
jgi:DNA polymerase-3 subunit delta